MFACSAKTTDRQAQDTVWSSQEPPYLLLWLVTLQQQHIAKSCPDVSAGASHSRQIWNPWGLSNWGHRGPAAPGHVLG